MRYRPLGKAGMAVSALTLRLKGDICRGDPDAWVGVVHGAMEQGVNSFEVSRPTPALIEGLGAAAQAVERRLFFVSLRLASEQGPDAIFAEAERMLAGTGLGFLDLVVADADHDLHNDAVWMLEDLRATGKTKRIGVAGQTDKVDQHLNGTFDVLLAPFNILSGWRERLRVRNAVERSMSVIGDNYFPDDARTLAEPQPVKRRWFSKPAYPLAGLGAYNFLHTTHAWNPEEICLGFALTEPALASVAIDFDGMKHLEALAAVTERDLPAAVAAQIEMARFSAERASGTERRRSA
ncbi:MAG TPA: aldo/keto reductase [Caulobacteraceae bacterium]|nr:aldo/keto reductase [Caulobacteraceae bacterium]